MDRARFTEIAARFPGCRIVVLGDVMLDRYVSGEADRVSPEAPVPVVRVRDEWDAAGGAGNVAANVIALGARCEVIGVVGEDQAGRALTAVLTTAGAGCRFVRDSDRATTVKTRLLARGQQIARVDREETAPVSTGTREALVASLTEAIPGAHALVLADYDKGVLSPSLIRHSLVTASALGIPTVVDPKARNFLSCCGATVFKPNRAEIEAALGEQACPRDVHWMEAARVRIGCEHLLLTLGADGMALASPGGGLEGVHARARAVFDVSGAGDTVAAVVAVALAVGAPLVEAVRVAAHTAAVGVGKVGVATVAPAEIAEALAGEVGRGR
ncbi:MAG: PfkB family carbohydrate kinase [Gemmatimonadota bacterium]|nr:PfkB family carbohydrate kinase [Gemmatimonadota bacterium]